MRRCARLTQTTTRNASRDTCGVGILTLRTIPASRSTRQCAPTQENGIRIVGSGGFSGETHARIRGNLPSPSARPVQRVRLIVELLLVILVWPRIMMNNVILLRTCTCRCPMELWVGRVLEQIPICSGTTFFLALTRTISHITKKKKKKGESISPAKLAAITTASGDCRRSPVVLAGLTDAEHRCVCVS